MLQSSTVGSSSGSSSGSKESAIADHSNVMTKKAYATFIPSLRELALQLRVPVGPLSQSAN